MFKWRVTYKRWGYQYQLILLANSADAALYRAKRMGFNPNKVKVEAC